VKEIDMNEEFLATCEKEGKNVINAIKVYSYKDLQLLRSMLYSCGIQNYVQFENMMNIRGGVGIERFNDAFIQIFEDDIEETKQVFEDYVAGNGDTINAGEKIRNMAEYLLAGWLVTNKKKPYVIKE
jgi:hypothetical protein